jgi:hypothetical protein
LQCRVSVKEDAAVSNKLEYLSAKELTLRLGGHWSEHSKRGDASCPVAGHDDAKPSLSIGEAEDGKALVRCQRGCSQAAVLAALEAKGIWPAGNPNKIHGKPHGKAKGHAAKLGPVVARYDYHDAEGELRFQVRRHEPKTFRQWRPDGSGGWTPGLPLRSEYRFLPFRLPEVLEAIALDKPVFVLEGEKDVENAFAKLCITATCNSGGASASDSECKWKPEHAAYLKGADIIIIPDNDTAGTKHANGVAASLQGIAKRTRVITLPGSPPKGDLSDWIAAGGTAEQLWALAEAAEDWKPSADQSRVDADLAAFNDKYAVVRVSGKTRIVSMEDAPSYPGCKVPVYSSIQDFCAFHAHPKKTVISETTGRERQVGIGKWWVGHEKRCQYDGIIYAPNADHDANRSKLNLWAGFGCEPAEGDCEKYLAHLKDNICGGVQEYYQYLLNWMAYAVQYPGRQGEVAVVLRGKEGTGKGVGIGQFGRLFGAHYRHVSQAGHLTGHFNAHLQNCSLLFADEAFFAGDRPHENILKAIITEDMLIIEPKGLDAYAVRNCLHLMMSSNSDWVVPAGADARRYFVLGVADTRKQDHSYFAAILNEMNEGGREALLHLLLHRNLSGFNVRSVPQTDALKDQKAYSRRGVDRLVEIIAHEGVLPVPHASYPDIAVSTGEERGEGFYTRARILSPDLKHLSSIVI